MYQIPFDPYDFFGYVASGVLVVFGMDLVFGFPHLIGHTLGVLDLALLVVAVYVAGQMVATPAKAFLEDGIVGKILQRPAVNLLRDKQPWLGRVIFPGFYRPLPSGVRDRVLSNAKTAGVELQGEDLFLHARYHRQILADERLMAKLGSFLNKYGFARNLAFVSFVLGVGLLTKSVLVADPTLAKYGWTAIVSSLLLFYRFLKFYRQYSFELFNVFGTLSS